VDTQKLCTGNSILWFSFDTYGPGIFTPVIRRQIRKAQVTDKGHYTVYLPAYDDGRLFNFLSHFKQVKWQVFLQTS
jgi:hypothetical protein